ncbi:MAG: ABC transporter permease, partial [Bacteroides sp.]|nr:ABC transporter permease [Bacteroides sp.]
MRILLTLLQKEFKQIFRNKLMLPIIFIVPVVQMILLTYAASMEMKGITMAVVDQDFSQASRNLASHFEGSPFFEIKLTTNSYQEAEDELTGDRVDVILHLKRDFEKSLYRDKQTDLQLVVNAINATEAGLVNAYCTQIITAFNGQIRSEWFNVDGRGRQVAFEVIPSYWYNPLLDFKIYMFSGILVIIVTLIGMLLTALNLVREKEMGTTEQINVTPVRKYQFILAKLLPFMVIAL